ncbi:MAG: ABC transporter substrate-binding protein [Syntrophobacteraceae bacterium]
MRKGAWIPGVLALAFILTGPAFAASKGPIKLGVTEPLSGNFKDIGQHYLEGVQYAAKVINEKGGLLGRKIEVIPIDSELKPAVTVRKAQELILRDHVKFFCGGTGSSIGSAMSDLAKRQKVIMFTYGMGAASLTGKDCNRYFFRPTGNTDGQSYAIAGLIAKAGYKRIGIIAQDYSFGHEAVEAFTKKLAELNPSAKIVAKIYHPLGTMDFAPYVSQLIAAKPDVIFTSNWGNDLTLLFKQGEAMGLKTKVYGYYLNDDDMIKALGNDDKAILGDVGVETYMVSIPTAKNRAFVKKFYKDTGHYPTWLRGKAYMATMFWANAVKKAGSTNVNAVIKAWEGLTYNGPAGVYTMRACDHQAQVPFWYATIVQKNPYFKHAFVGPATMIPAASVSVPCDQTGCNMK